MKTTSFARGIFRIRRIVLGLALVGTVVIAFGAGEFLATRVGPYTAAQTQAPQAPNLSLGDLMAAGAVVR